MNDELTPKIFGQTLPSKSHRAEYKIGPYDGRGYTDEFGVLYRSLRITEQLSVPRWKLYTP